LLDFELFILETLNYFDETCSIPNIIVSHITAFIRIQYDVLASYEKSPMNP